MHTIIVWFCLFGFLKELGRKIVAEFIDIYLLFLYLLIQHKTHFFFQNR